MKTIGLLGGLSWESSQEYYRIVNTEVKKRLGGLHSARCVLYSVDFAQVAVLQHEGDWRTLTEFMIEAARQVERGGADLLLVCSNTMHKMAERVAAAIDIPLVHIADAAAEAVRAQGLSTVGLLGTRFTMEGGFYKDRIERKYGIKVLLPATGDRETIHRVIYDELVQGTILPASRAAFQEIIGRLAAAGAQGIILGCTEIPLLISQADSQLPIFDTTLIHARRAVDLALA